MSLFNFKNDKFVKLPTQDWEDIKSDYNGLIQENKRLRAQITEGTSEEVAELKAIIAKQSESLKKLAKWKDNDDLVYAHEKWQEETKTKVAELESQVTQLEKENSNLSAAYLKEREIANLLAKKLSQYTGQCPDYRTASKFELYA